MYAHNSVAWTTSLYELVDRLTDQPWSIGSETHHFHEGVIPDQFYGASRLELNLLVRGHGLLMEPLYFVDLRCFGNELQLWYGWEGKTHHLAQSWRRGKWRQDIIPALPGILRASGLGATRQVISPQELRQEVERELQALFRRLDSTIQTGVYSLTWDEMAAMLIRFTDSWNATRKSEPFTRRRMLLSDTYAQLHHQKRGGPLEIHISLDDRSKPSITLIATRDQHGWRLDVFSALCPKTLDLRFACGWYGAIVFTDDHRGTSAYRSCPLGHGHQETVEPTAPWSLFEFFCDEWLPLFDAWYKHWGVHTYTALPYDLRTQMEPSATVQDWLLGSALPEAVYKGTDTLRGHEYWHVGHPDLQMVIDSCTLTLVAYVVGNNH